MHFSNEKFERWYYGEFFVEVFSGKLSFFDCDKENSDFEQFPATYSNTTLTFLYPLVSVFSSSYKEWKGQRAWTQFAEALLYVTSGKLQRLNLKGVLTFLRRWRKPLLTTSSRDERFSSFMVFQVAMCPNNRSKGKPKMHFFSLEGGPGNEGEKYCSLWKNSGSINGTVYVYINNRLRSWKNEITDCEAEWFLVILWLGVIFEHNDKFKVVSKEI